MTGLAGLLLWAQLAGAAAPADEARPLQSRRELFVDHYLIDKMDRTKLVLHHPKEESIVLTLDKPWEGPFCGYFTVIRDGPLYHLYYRGLPRAGADGSPNEVTCYAQSRDGLTWTKPNLGLFEVMGSRENNVVLAEAPPFSHNFCPLLDTRPGMPKDERFKALAGTGQSGLVAFASADGIHWRKWRPQPVITRGAFESQNVAFWSAGEQCYVCYFRTWEKVRRISRTTSRDFLQWTPPVLMEYEHPGSPAPLEHMYTNQTQPYFRTPHIYVATAARFCPGRQAITEEQARVIHVDGGYFKDVSDAVLMTTRGGNVYQRTFLEGFLRPGIGPENWVSRTNYPALGVVQTGPGEMSMFVHHNYAQPTTHLRRYSLRLDGFASVHAPYEGGEMITRLLTFTGQNLHLNYATSAPGGIRIEIQDVQGKAIPGYSLEESRELIGNEVHRAVSWKSGADVSRLAGTPLRLRFVMKDADLYSFQFR